ncbi:uncharacterized protein IUM83_09651 [Phytophthora cinnamomi]|uniref:uncharacterized protein n=1 Tax=Phytophthora cinnamomi TaxID=4785 RepID=UPI00355A731A|nr:hypothetical protein IUM83_09651 [Phytophthora cinnamomi]
MLVALSSKPKPVYGVAPPEPVVSANEGKRSSRRLINYGPVGDALMVLDDLSIELSKVSAFSCACCPTLSTSLLNADEASSSANPIVNHSYQSADNDCEPFFFRRIDLKGGAGTCTLNPPANGAAFSHTCGVVPTD